jgi:hypothetical protein
MSVVNLSAISQRLNNAQNLKLGQAFASGVFPTADWKDGTAMISSSFSR